MQRLDILSERAAERYSAFAAGISNNSLRQMMQPAGLSVYGVRMFQESAVRMGKLFLESEQEFLENHLSELSKSAYESALSDIDVAATPDLLNALNERYSVSHDTSFAHLSSEIASQINRDINSTSKLHREAALRVQVMIDSRGMVKEEAQAEVRTSEMKSARQLSFQDKAGRKVKSSVHVHRIWRQTLRDEMLHAYMNALAFMGHQFAVLTHPEPGHSAQGIRLENGKVDFGVSNLTRTLHPNSRAFPVSINRYEEMI